MTPVTWPVVVPDRTGNVPPWSTATPADRGRAEALAVQILHSLTGRVLGTRTVFARPCFSPPDERTTYAGPTASGIWPGLLQGNPNVSGPCGCADAGCNSRGGHSYALPGPVVEVLAVFVDGDLVDPDAYRVRNHRWLIRTDGLDWPQTQDLRLTSDKPGTFAVRYVRGVEVSEGGQVAAGLLAVELLRGMTGSACALPANISNMVREGVTVTFAPEDFLKSGLTGISEVDQWVTSVNPHRTREPARVIIPGRQR